MTLKQYIKSKRLTVTQAAKELGYTRPYITAIVNGKQEPGRKLIEKLVAWSNKELSVQDFF